MQVAIGQTCCLLNDKFENIQVRFPDCQLLIANCFFSPLQPSFDSYPGNDKQIRRTNDVKCCRQPPQVVHPRIWTYQTACRTQTPAYNRDCCCRILAPHPGADRHLVKGHHACRQGNKQVRDSPAQEHSHFIERTCDLGFLAEFWYTAWTYGQAGGAFEQKNFSRESREKARINQTLQANSCHSRLFAAKSS